MPVLLRCGKYAGMVSDNLRKKEREGSVPNDTVDNGTFICCAQVL
jgi:hypothetical protein